jgi:hypothetical protein
MPVDNNASARLPPLPHHQPKAKRQRSDLYRRQHRQYVSDKRGKETVEERACRLKKMRDYIRGRRARLKARAPTIKRSRRQPVMNPLDGISVPSACPRNPRLLLLSSWLPGSLRAHDFSVKTRAVSGAVHCMVFKSTYC